MIMNSKVRERAEFAGITELQAWRQLRAEAELRNRLNRECMRDIRRAF